MIFRSSPRSRTKMTAYHLTATSPTLLANIPHHGTFTASSAAEVIDTAHRVFGLATLSLLPMPTSTPAAPISALEAVASLEAAQLALEIFLIEARLSKRKAMLLLLEERQRQQLASILTPTA